GEVFLGIEIGIDTDSDSDLDSFSLQGRRFLIAGIHWLIFWAWSF
ncbi:MAG: hypothetical protein RLZZ224_1027, partial [Verrucomicrobiota bacterium]